MNELDPLHVYRRLVATADDGVVNWWYSGWTFVELADELPIPVMQVAAIMTYRTQTLAADRFRMHWSEVGLFRDPRTGEPPTEWHNPVTGAIVQPPRGFLEGPGSWTLARAGAGLSLDIQQPHATVRSATIGITRHGSRLRIRQEERKLRGFPAPDGKLPAAGSGASFEGLTELVWYADAAAVDAPAPAVQGIYSFTLGGLPPWMGFGDRAGRAITRGRITRAAPQERVDRLSWERLAALYPAEVAEPPALRA